MPKCKIHNWQYIYTKDTPAGYSTFDWRHCTKCGVKHRKKVMGRLFETAWIPVKRGAYDTERDIRFH